MAEKQTEYNETDKMSIRQESYRRAIETSARAVKDLSQGGNQSCRKELEAVITEAAKKLVEEMKKNN